MATTTTNLGLTKPAYADTADIDVINGNMDILDGAVNAVEGGMAIISNNNTHAAVLAGNYIYVRKHGTLAEGLYKARSNIAANATLSTANLETVSGGLGGEIIGVNQTIDNWAGLSLKKNTEAQLGTNFNTFPDQSFGWANNTTQGYTNAPAVSAFHVITIKSLSTHGFQLAVKHDGTTMYLRTLSDGNWGNWRNISFT